MQSFKTDSVAQRLCFNCSWSKFKHLLLVRLLFYLFTYLFIHLFFGWVEESSFRFPMAIKLGWRTEVWVFLKCKAAKILVLARITRFFFFFHWKGLLKLLLLYVFIAIFRMVARTAYSSGEQVISLHCIFCFQILKCLNLGVSRRGERRENGSKNGTKWHVENSMSCVSFIFFWSSQLYMRLHKTCSVCRLPSQTLANAHATLGI